VIWPQGRQRDGGIDLIPTPAGCGRLWLCGKHVVGPDPEAARASIAPEATIVCLNEPGDLVRYPDYVRWLRTSANAVWFPMPDFDAPSADDIRPLIDDIAVRLRTGGDVIMHCSAGLGRAGTTAICVLMELGVAPSAAVEVVSTARPGAGPQAGPQSSLVGEYARLHR
jgi:hypothetical protein